ncbi:MAG TPA: hypothetical protein VEH77_18545 [Roseiarcus sp.]|nr:hypothetical protein [Roseiarcus sp.]
MDELGVKERAPPAAANGSTQSAERPFLGLRPFAFEDREYFFGRESQAFALYRLADAGRFIAVVGGSGSGKSSLVLAGLCNLLDQETQDPNGRRWVWGAMRPGGTPVRRLAETLARIFARDKTDVMRLRDRIETRLRQSSFSLESALEEGGDLAGRRLLLIVDQFEELFRFGLAGMGRHGSGVAEAKARDEATLLVQILLDARRMQDVRVLITMRSDFIGDCAFFAGLPEAVSATQYLVPGLTRMQLEEVIRRPIEQAGGAIEPELVERLLIDCSEEFDQLPVLQHCLMRMWDNAGTTSGGGPRRLTRQTYDDIGRMTEALSHHADEILRQCPDREMAVEQAFRALSEFDREGRAIRRPLRFDKLLAEAGVTEADLRAVIDKFRTLDCSFLVPSQSSAPIIAPEERVDIGHEALLRRWRKLAGESEKVEAATGRPPAGWLAKEQLDGQRYRTLASLLDSSAGEMATLNDPERVRLWWNALPRTADWADRYGGKFESVKRLIDNNISASRRARFMRHITWAAAVAMVFVVGGALAYGWRESTILEQENRLRGEARAASQLIHDFLDAYHKGKITESGALSLEPMISNFTSKVRGQLSPPEAGKLWVEGLNAETELSTASKDPDAAPRMAQAATEAGEKLARQYPKEPEVLQMQFEGLLRGGDILTARNDVDAAVAKYDKAIAAAEKLSSFDQKSPAFDAKERAAGDLVRARLGLGDTYLMRSPPSPGEALKEYGEAHKIAVGLKASDPNDEDVDRDLAATDFRTGVAYAELGHWQDAYAALRGAQSIQERLSKENISVKWDLADTDMKLGEVIAAMFGPRARPRR